MQHIVKKEITDLERDMTPLGEEGEVDRLVRLTARFCSLIRAANRMSWFDSLVRDEVSELQADLENCLDGGSLRIDIAHDGLRMGDAHFDEPPKAVRQFMRMFNRKGLSAVEFRDGVSELELVVLCQILQSKTAKANPHDLDELKHIDLKEEIEIDRIEIPEVIRPSRLGTVLHEGRGADDEVRNQVAEITGAIDGLSPADVAESEASAVEGTKSALGLLELVDDLGSNAEITLILSSLRRHDEYTYDHSVNVGLLSICLARALGWSGRDLHEFGVAALIHDVGKLYTPVEVLNKPGRLTPQEWIVMKHHPRDGYDILKEGGVGSAMAPYIALEHHIGFDGAGYPPLTYKGVHPGSQIVKIADVYDAFTTIRPYRSQARPKEVLKLLSKQAGTSFHPDYVEAFCSMMGAYPIGSTVKLASGNIGLVVDLHAEVEDRPVVRVLQNENGKRQRNLQLIDLSQRDPVSGEFIDEVVETIDPVIRNIPVGRYI